MLGTLQQICKLPIRRHFPNSAWPPLA
jgi:hypothetical protein